MLCPRCKGSSYSPDIPEEDCQNCGGTGTVSDEEVGTILPPDIAADFEVTKDQPIVYGPLIPIQSVDVKRN